MTLRLSTDLALPLDAVTQSLAIMAKRRAGKSYAARRLAEQLFHAGQQIVVADPKGDWWGLRSAADGKRAGLPIVILGGEHGDAPLEPNAGALVAHLVVEERVSVLLDLSLPRKHEVVTFMTAFLETLYRLKARERYRTPMMLFIDEADAIAPQRPQRGEERMLGAAEDIVRRGGQRGLGCTLITQRSAVLNKNVLTQTQVMVALRTIAPQDLAAMEEWIHVHGTVEQKREMIASLPALPIGTAWFWSPGWPDADGIFKQVRILPIETFDSGATPRPGEKRTEPKTLADVDLEALRRKMAETFDRARANDPKTLRAKIAALEREIEAVKGKPSERIEVPVPAVSPADLEQLTRCTTELKATGSEISTAISAISAIISALGSAPKPDPHPGAFRISRESVFSKAVDVDALLEPAGRISKFIKSSPAGVNSGVAVTRPQQAIINALAGLETVRIKPAKKTLVALFSRVSPSSGSFQNNLGRLRSLGLIDYPGPGLVVLTDAGRGAASPTISRPSTEGLHAIVADLLPAPQWRILEILLAIYPKAIEKSELAPRAGASATSGSFQNNLGRLRSLGLIDYPAQGRAIAESLLFLE